MNLTRRYLITRQLWHDWRVFHRRHKYLWRMSGLKCSMVKGHRFRYTVMYFNQRIDVTIEFLYGPYKHYVEKPPPGMAMAIVTVDLAGQSKHKLAVHKDDWSLLPDYLRLRAIYGLSSVPNLTGLATTPIRLLRQDNRLVLGREIE